MVYLETGVGVGAEDLFEDFFGVGSQHFRFFVLSHHDFFVEFVGVGVFEGEEAAEHCIEDDAAGPDIDVGALISLACDHFGCSIAG